MRLINSFLIYLTYLIYLIYDIYFPKVFVRLKTKHIQSPWITKGIAKSSKKKQKFYENFLKHRTRETELAYK